MRNQLNEREVIDALSSYIDRNSVSSYPIEIDANEVGINLAKQIILFMACQSLINFDSTHCTPLPPTLFKEPVDLFSLLASASKQDYSPSQSN